jgi:hypothetical protein
MRSPILSHVRRVRPSIAYHDKPKDLRVFHFPMHVCNRCPVQEDCTKAGEGRRTVGISLFNKELREAELYNVTEAFKEDMKLRAPIEGKLSELTRYHGMRRARYRGLRNGDVGVRSTQLTK